MGLFANVKALERLEDRLRLVEGICDSLERDRKKLDLEFTDLYDKVRHQMSRMAKRDAVAQRENGEDLIPDAPLDQFPGVDPISKSIMLRRGMGKFKT